jgi:hypothetical protein
MVQDLCVPGYTKKVRNVPAGMKREVYEEYGAQRTVRATMRSIT